MLMACWLYFIWCLTFQFPNHMHLEWRWQSLRELQYQTLGMVYSYDIFFCIFHFPIFKMLVPDCIVLQDSSIAKASRDVKPCQVSGKKNRPQTKLSQPGSGQYQGPRGGHKSAWWCVSIREGPSGVWSMNYSQYSTELTISLHKSDHCHKSTETKILGKEIQGPMGKEIQGPMGKEIQGPI